MNKNSYRIRFVSNLCILILLLSLSVCSVFATDITYNLKEIGITIDIPDNMQVITRETQEDDLVFSNFGLSYQSVMTDFDNNSIYLQAADVENYLTLTITMTETSDSLQADNYNELTEDELNHIKDEFLSNPAYQQCKVKEVNGCKFLCLTVKEKINKKSVYSQQYNTVVNGENYIISLQAPESQQLTVGNKATLNRIMKSVVIKEKTFFNQYGQKIIIITSCVIALAGIIALFIFLFKYIKSPKRRHNDIVHQLAHEHGISETSKIPRKKLHQYMIDNTPEITDEEYQPEEDVKYYNKKEKIESDPMTADTIEIDRDRNLEFSGNSQEDENEYVKVYGKNKKERKENTEDFEKEIDSNEIYSRTTHVNKRAGKIETIIEPAEELEGTDYFEDVPEERDMYVYTDVDEAVEDYDKAKRQQTIRKEREKSRKKEKPEVNIVLKVLKFIGKGLLNILQTIGVVLLYIAIHLKYFTINVYRLIKRKIRANKRKKEIEEKKRRADERRKRQYEAEMYRQRENRNRGENDLVMVRSRGESRRPRDNRGSRPRR